MTSDVGRFSRILFLNYEFLRKFSRKYLFPECLCENMSKTRANAWGSSKKFLFLRKIELFPPNVLRKQKQSGEFRENENCWTISVKVFAKMKLFVKT